MGQRSTTIGIIYQSSNEWIAGAYYIQNIVSALNRYCSNIKAPKISVFCYTKDEFNELKETTQYPNLSFHQINANPCLLLRLFFGVIKRITGKRLTVDDFVLKREKFVYPVTDININTNGRKTLAWIPDFQEKYYPEFFPDNQIEKRNAWHRELINNNIPIVFSSRDAQSDFRKYYPNATSTRTFVLPFAVVHPDFSNEKIFEIKSKYGIEDKYLFCANQFWIHKNHKTLFKAINILCSKGVNIQLVCSGSLYEHRSDSYHQELIDYIKENNLSKKIIVLGFIRRTEQLCIMKNAYAVVQPSLFEGWSTVVEDAKRLNKFIFLSDLRVHREQNPSNVCFFDPNNEIELSDKIMNTVITEKNVDYSKNVFESGRSFYRIIQDL